MKLTRCLLFLVFILFTVNATIETELRDKLKVIVNQDNVLDEAAGGTEIDLIIFSYANSKPLCSEQLAQDCEQLKVGGSNPCAGVSEVFFLRNTRNPSKGGCYLHIQGDFDANNVKQLMKIDEEHPEVVSMDLNGETRADVCDNQQNAPWHLSSISQTVAPSFVHDPFAGSGVTVYMLDSGICQGCENRHEFFGRILEINNFHQGSQDGYDTHSHGTHVAGTIIGETYGVARGANLVSLRVFGHNGSGSSAYTLAALQYVQQQCQPASARCVINHSGGGAQRNHVDNAWNLVAQDGIPCVVAAGNENVDASLRSPANAADTITVGNSNQANQRHIRNNNSGSNYGARVDIFAPGTNILSEGLVAGQPIIKTGTSMASPIVAGIVAAIMGRLNRKMQKADVMARLNGVAVPVVNNNPGGTRNFVQYVCGAPIPFPQPMPQPNIQAQMVAASAGWIELGADDHTSKTTVQCNDRLSCYAEDSLSACKAACESYSEGGEKCNALNFRTPTSPRTGTCCLQQCANPWQPMQGKTSVPYNWQGYVNLGNDQLSAQSVGVSNNQPVSNDQPEEDSDPTALITAGVLIGCGLLFILSVYCYVRRKKQWTVDNTRFVRMSENQENV